MNSCPNQPNQMTNEQILIAFMQQYNVKKLIEKNIHKSRYHSSEDLQQYIFIELLKRPNEVLVEWYEKKILVKIVVRIILNQRNYSHSYYNKQLKIVDYDIFDGFEIEDALIDVDERIAQDDFKDAKYKCLKDFFLNNVYTGKTMEDAEKFIAVSFLALKMGVEIVNDKIVLIKPMTMTEIAKNFVDEKINVNKLKTKTYICKNYIMMGKELLVNEFKKKNYI